MTSLDTFARDVRYAARTLARTPGFAVLAVLIIGLGIGANTAIFSLVSAVLLEPLPFVEPDELVVLWDDGSAVGASPRSPISLASYVDWRERSTSLEGIAAFQSRSYNLTGDGEPERLDALRTTPNLLSILGLQPVVGRTFAPDEVAEATPVVVVSQSLWMRRFGADPNVVGREIVLDGSKYTVIGVVPPQFRFPWLRRRRCVHADGIHSAGARRTRRVGQLRRRAAQARRHACTSASGADGDREGRGRGEPPRRAEPANESPLRRYKSRLRARRA